MKILDFYSSKEQLKEKYSQIKFENAIRKFETESEKIPVETAYFTRNIYGVEGIVLITNSALQIESENLEEGTRRSHYIDGDIYICMMIIEKYELNYDLVLEYETQKLQEKIERIDPLNSAEVQIRYTNDNEIYALVWGYENIYCNRPIAENLCRIFNRNSPKSKYAILNFIFCCC